MKYMLLTNDKSGNIYLASFPTQVHQTMGKQPLKNIHNVNRNPLNLKEPSVLLFPSPLDSSPLQRLLDHTWEINGATIAPIRHREPLVPIPNARIIVG